MKNWKKTLGILQGVLFLLCGVDGLCTLLGVPYTDTMLNLIIGNTLSALFFVPMALSLVFAWKTWEEQPVRLIRLWSLVVILGSLGVMLLVLLVGLNSTSALLTNSLMVIFVVLNLPTINCSIMALPIFAWSLLLVISHTMLKKMRWK